MALTKLQDSHPSNTRLRALFFLLFSHVLVIASNGQETVPVPGILQQGEPLEKIYLHSDRESYLQGDTLWFKAYLWQGYRQQPDTTSIIVYADLLNPSGSPVVQKKLLVENGTAHGEIGLGEDLSAGQYTLCAYTRDVQTFGNGQPYCLPVTVNSPEESLVTDFDPVVISNAGYDSLQVTYRFYEFGAAGGITGDVRNVEYSLSISDELFAQGTQSVQGGQEQVFRHSLAGMAENDSLAVFKVEIELEDTVIRRVVDIPLRDKISLQFFPEGGMLISGHPSKMAFKATGPVGTGREVAGIVTDNNGDTAAVFESIHKGMGSFVFTPEQGRQYTASFGYKGLRWEAALPEAKDTGCSMTVSRDSAGETPRLLIRDNTTMLTQPKYVVVSSHGQVVSIDGVVVENGERELGISTEHLPEGIARVTILNHNYEPECERLMYVDKQGRFRIEVTADSSSYHARSKATLKVRATDMEGNPVQADLSVAVVDKEQAGEGTAHGINAYKLLTSELKGYIEEPDYYFENGESTDEEALDLVMLTHGYREFKVRQNTDSIPAVADPEFYITGRVEHSREGKKMDYREVSLVLLNTTGEQKYVETTPDSLGRFSITLPLQFGDANCVLQARNKRDKPFKGYIYLDENHSPAGIEVPQMAVVSEPQQNTGFVRQLQETKRAAYETEMQDIAMSFTLDEIDVTAKDKKWFRRFEENAVQVADLDTLDPDADKYENLHDLLVKEFDAYEDRTYYSSYGYKAAKLPFIGWGPSLPWTFPLYVVNGTPWISGDEPDRLDLYRMVEDFDVGKIKKVMVVPPGKMVLRYLRQEFSLIPSMVVIETYEDTYRGDPRGIETLVIKGLDAPRAFYSPDYEISGNDNPAYDNRATLYWNPSLVTDENGEATVEFFTSDSRSDMVANIRGMEVTGGNPGEGSIEFGTENDATSSLSMEDRK